MIGKQSVVKRTDVRTFQTGWGYAAATIAMCAFVLVGFWGNHVLFADIRPRHTVPNVIVAALVVWLLWFGYASGSAPM